MVEESQTDGAPSQEEASSADVSAGFQNLGQNLKEIFQNAWPSEDRQKLQQDIESSLADFAVSINKAVEDYKESPSGQRLKSDVEDFHMRVKSGEVEGKAREELASVLQKINSELEKVSERTGSTSETEREDSEES